MMMMMILYRRSGLYLGHTYGSGSGQIWLDELQCTGSELSLDDCSHRGWGLYRPSCTHLKDVSILCGNGTIIYLFN